MRNILHTIKRRKVNWTVTSCLGTSFQNKLVRERQKRREDDEEDTIFYIITLRKREYTRILKSTPFVKCYGLVTKQTTNDKYTAVLT
jgi:hypothetical protein